MPKKPLASTAISDPPDVTQLVAIVGMLQPLPKADRRRILLSVADFLEVDLIETTRPSGPTTNEKPLTLEGVAEIRLRPRAHYGSARAV